MTAVKFCGLTRPQDVRAAVRLGVDYIGLNFVPQSPRYLSADQAAGLVEVARREAGAAGRRNRPAIVGVFAEDGAVDEVRATCPLDYVQWHGTRGPAPAILPLIRALRLRPGEAAPQSLPADAWAYLLDAHHERLLGGTGLLADWEVGSALARRCRLFLAGGLKPDNVGEAVTAVRPYAVDVASGIEIRPGVKDEALMCEFLEEVRKADGSN